MDEYDRARLELHKAVGKKSLEDIKYWTGYVDAVKYMLKRHGATEWDFELADERLVRAIAALR